MIGLMKNTSCVKVLAMFSLLFSLPSFAQQKAIFEKDYVGFTE